MIEIIYGGSGCGKTTSLIERIEKILKSDDKSPIFYIMPDQYTFQMEKKLSKCYSNGLKDPYARVNVLSFSALSRLILTHMGGINDVVIDNGGKSIMTCMAMKKSKNSLNIYKNLYGHSGFVTSISGIISEIRQYNIEASELLDVAEDNSSLSEKLRDISKIYSEYEKILSREWIDSTDLITKASIKGENFGVLDDAYVFFDEFTGFTPNQYKLVELLMKKAKYTGFALTIHKKNLAKMSTKTYNSVFSRSIYTIEKIKEIAGELGIRKINYTLAGETSKRTDKKDLAFLEKNYHAFPYEIYGDKPENIIVSEYNDEFDEVRGIAEKIVKLVKHSNCRFRDFAITARDIKKYDYIFRAVFDEFSIPYFLDEKVKAEDNPLISLVLTLLEIKEKGYEYEDVILFLKNPLVKIEEKYLYELENFALANNITGKKWLRDFTKIKTVNNIDYDLDKEENESMDDIEKVREKYIGIISKAVDSLKSAVNASDYCRAVYDFLMDAEVDRTFAEIIEKAKKEENNSLMLEYSQIWNILMDSFDQIVKISGDEKLSFADFKLMAGICLKQYEVGVVPLGLDQVMVSSVPRFKSDTAKIIFSCGINEGEFPRPPKENNIIGDMDRETLLKKGIYMDMGSSYKVFEEEYLVYKLLSSAVDKLYLSYPISRTSSGSGESVQRPSNIISRIKRLFPELETESFILDSDSDRYCDFENYIENMTSPSPEFNMMVSRLGQIVREGEVCPDEIVVLRAVLEHFKKDRELGEIASIFENSLKFENKSEKLDPELANIMFGKKSLSISRFDVWNRCPYSYFVNYGLNASPRKVYGFEASDMGSFVHKVIDIFSTELEKDGLKFSEVDFDYINSSIDAIVKDILFRIPDYILNSNKRFLNNTRRYTNSVKKSMRWVKKQLENGDFEPLFHELEFGAGKDIPALPVQTKNGYRFSITGKIDRIDICEIEEDYKKVLNLKVVDYKTGKKEFKLKDIFDGYNLQLVIYMAALMNCIKDDRLVQNSKLKNYASRLKPVASQYAYVKDEILSDGDVKPEIFNLDRAEAEKYVDNLKGKKYIPNGFYINVDENNSSVFDKDMVSSKSSISLELTSKGEIKNNYTEKEYEIIEKYALMKTSNMYEEMVSGKINISPKLDKTSDACEYCEFRGICHFDNSLASNNYRPVLTPVLDGIKKNGRQVKRADDSVFITRMREAVEEDGE